MSERRALHKTMPSSHTVVERGEIRQVYSILGKVIDTTFTFYVNLFNQRTAEAVHKKSPGARQLTVAALTGRVLPERQTQELRVGVVDEVAEADGPSAQRRDDEIV